MGIAKWMLAAAAFAAVVAVEKPCPAMVDADLTGNTWDASYASKLRVPGVGRGTDSTTGGVSFASDGTFSATEDDDGVPRTYTGTWKLRNGGTELKARLDANGKAELRRAIASWISETTGARRVRLQFTRASFRVAQVPATAGPFTMKLSSAGTGSGVVGGQRVYATFTHSSTISLTPQ